MHNFSNPYTMVWLGRDGKREILLSEALQNFGLTSFGRPFDMKQNFAAPFITDMEIIMSTKNSMECNFTMEVPTSSVDKIRKELLNINAKYNYFFVEFGYWSDLSSRVLGFYTSIPDISIDDGATLSYKGIFADGDDYYRRYQGKTIDVVNAGTTVRDLFKLLYPKANIVFSEIGTGILDQELFDRQMTVSGQSFHKWCSKELADAKIEWTVNPNENELNIVVVRNGAEIPKSSKIDILFLDKENMRQRIGVLDNETILPLLSYSAENIITTGGYYDLSTTSEDEDGNLITKDQAADEINIVTNSSANTGNRMAQDSNLGIFSSGLTIETLMYPHVFPLETNIAILTPIDHLNASEFIVNKVTHKLVADYSTMIETIITNTKINNISEPSIESNYTEKLLLNESGVYYV